ncbi:MAG: tRNA lysidine(34) synthetase TilS, partial [Planctomycetota bacterium]
LGRTASGLGAHAIATAHHADDVAETVLLRLLRGAAITGLGGLPACRRLSAAQPDVRLIRPLLEVRKAELLGFLEGRGQPFCIDSSNQDTDFTRNRVRHVLLPALERDFPAFSVDSLCALNASALELAELLDALLSERWDALCRRSGPEEILLEAEALAAQAAAVRKAAAVRALSLLAGDEPPPALRAQHYEALAALPHREVGVEVSLPRGLFARREHGIVYFSRRSAGAPGGMLRPLELAVPGSVHLPGLGLTIESRPLPAGEVGPEEAAELASGFDVHLSLEAAGRALQVRSRRPGDRFHPLGAPGATRLKKYFIDQKVPRHRRDRIPLVTAASGEIAWVVGYQIGEAFRLRGAGPALRLSAHGHGNAGPGG